MLKVQINKFGTVVILRLEGRMVRGETSGLQGVVGTLSGVSTLVLDLAQLMIVDAWGLGVMLALREQTKAKGINFKLMNVPRPISQVLEITCLNTVFEITSPADILTLLPTERTGSGWTFARSA